MSTRLRITKDCSGRSDEIATLARNEGPQRAEVCRFEDIGAQSPCVANQDFEPRLQLPQPLDRPIETSPFLFHRSTCIGDVHAVCRCELSVSRRGRPTAACRGILMTPAVAYSMLHHYCGCLRGRCSSAAFTNRALAARASRPDRRGPRRSQGCVREHGDALGRGETLERRGPGSRGRAPRSDAESDAPAVVASSHREILPAGCVRAAQWTGLPPRAAGFQPPRRFGARETASKHSHAIACRRFEFRMVSTPLR